MLNKEKTMNSKKVNVSINPETMKLLTEERDRLAKILGFVPSYSQVIQHIVNQINKTT